MSSLEKSQKQTTSDVSNGSFKKAEEESDGRKRIQLTTGRESVKKLKTTTPDKSQAEPYAPNTAEFEKHKNAWGYLQALIPDYPSDYLERQSYESSRRTGYLIGRSQNSDFMYGVFLFFIFGYIVYT